LALPNDDSTYSPSDDTILLADTLATYSYSVMLEIGFGSGLIIREASKRGEIVLGTEISTRSIKEAAKSLRERSNVLLVLGKAAEPFRQHSIDMIVINPPYLPSHEPVDLTVDGGTGGVQVLDEMLASAVEVLKSNGTILFLTSSLTNSNSLRVSCSRLGLILTTVARKKLFYEELQVYEAKLARTHTE
jgi:HemK-related putative methylase